MPDLTTGTDTELIAIPGTPPDLLHPPKGDLLVSRSHGVDVDFKEAPPWFQVSPTNYVKSVWMNVHQKEPPAMVQNACVKCQITTRLNK